MKRSPMKRQSAKARARRDADAEWSRAVLDRAGRMCQHPDCRQPANDAHHICPKSVCPDLRHDLGNGAALCRTHHRWVHDHPTEARALGFYAGVHYG